MSPRERLARLATAAAYPPTVLSLIAEATLPRQQTGDRLDDRGIELICVAVDVLRAARLSPDAVRELVAQHRDRDERWRERLWAEALRAASQTAQGATAPSAGPTPHRDVAVLPEHPA